MPIEEPAMPDRPPRLGATIEDYCSRCKLLLDHAIQAMAGEAIQAVVCKTCMSNHNFRHGKIPKRKAGKQSLLDQILAKKPSTPTFAMPTTKKVDRDDEE